MAEGTSTVNDPTNAGVPNAGDVNTAVLDNLAGGVPPSEGEQSSTPAQTPVADKTGQPAGEPPKPDDEGTLTRVSQDLARTQSVLKALGIDPDSDLAEQFQSGLVSKEDLLAQVGITPAASQVQQPVTQETSAYDKFKTLQQEAKQALQPGGKGLTEGAVLDLFDAMGGVADEFAQRQVQQDMSKVVENCIDATNAVINQDETHNQLPDDIKKIESQVFLSSTDNLLTTQTGGGQKYLTPRHYDFYAKKNMDRINALRNHYIEVGAQRERGKSSPTQQPTVTPISPSEGSAPLSPPKVRIDSSNVKDAAAKYVENFGVV